MEAAVGEKQSASEGDLGGEDGRPVRGGLKRRKDIGAEEDTAVGTGGEHADFAVIWIEQESRAAIRPG